MKKIELPSFFLANDASDHDGILRQMDMVAEVSGDFGIKLNLDIVLRDLSIISRITNEYEKKVFVDMKMWNGKRTMMEVVKTLADYGVAMTNVWAQAEDMLEKAVDALINSDMALFGLTVLTHYDDAWCRKYYGKDLNATVAMLAKTAMDFGCGGYILPGTTLRAVSDLPGLKFNPAVRPSWFKNPKANFQKQIMSPGEAKKAGADIVSCYSPVFKSDNPAKALQKILDEINAVK